MLRYCLAGGRPNFRNTPSAAFSISSLSSLTFLFSLLLMTDSTCESFPRARRHLSRAWPQASGRPQWRSREFRVLAESNSCVAVAALSVFFLCYYYNMVYSFDHVVYSFDRISMLCLL